MTDENPALHASPSDSALLPKPDRHYQPLLDAIAPWLSQAPPHRRDALKKTTPQLSAPLLQAPRKEHEKLRALNALQWAAQNRVEQNLARLLDARSFAELLLGVEIEKHFGLNLDVRQIFMRLYIPAHAPLPGLKSGAARTWTVALVDAALHNFESRETTDDAFETTSAYISRPTPEGQFSALPKIREKMPIPAFTKLCRDLDIGQRYKIYLEDNLGISNPVVAAILQTNVKASDKAALITALQMAYMQKLLSGDIHRLILGLLDGLKYLRLNRQSWQCHALTIMNARLTGIVLFAPNLESADTTSRVVAYIPDDPEHPIREYPSTGEFARHLTQRLRDQDYQSFFSRFINHEDRGHFFGQLNNRLLPITWQPVSNGDPRPTWRENPVERAPLQMAATTIKGDLWVYLYQRKLDKILNDARVVSVSTAAVDCQARWALWDSFSEVAASLLNIVAFIALPFVPFLGELMLAYTAYQLLDETFEGIVDWAQGASREAFEHFMDAVESVVQVGAFAAGGVIAASQFRALLPESVVAFIDRLTPAKLPNGTSRYWQPDLHLYEQTISLPKDAKPDALGLHAHQGKTLLALEDKLYAVSRDSPSAQYRIDHPVRPEAYKPELKHNQAGVWQTELDQPLDWERKTLLSRSDPHMRQLPLSLQERLLEISGCEENALRKMHVELGQMPPLLADTLLRWHLDADIQTFIEQIGSERAEDYHQADPVIQLKLLHESGDWPADKGVRLVGRKGKVLWQTPTVDVPLLQIDASRLDAGNLLKTCLLRLSEVDAKTLLGEKPHTSPPTLESRTRTLRRRIAELAHRKRQSLFEDKYRSLQRNAAPLVQVLMDAEPGLPKTLAQSILETTSDFEREQLQHTVLPRRLAELTREIGLQVRATRALEGLELKATQDNLDTDRLIMHSLPRLPGWSQSLRLEVRHYAHSGPLIDSIGPLDATTRKVLVLTEQGQYQPFDDAGEQLSAPGPLLFNLLQALPDAERLALNVGIGESEKLNLLIRQHSLNRDELLTLLSQNPNRKPAYDPSVMRLLGGTTGFRRMPTNTPTLQSHAHRLLPHLLPEELEAFVERLQRHPSGPRGELNRLFIERGRLDEVLNPWVNAIPVVHPETGAPLTTEQYAIQRIRRRQMRVDLLDCWKQQVSLPMDSEHMIDLRLAQPIIGELPALEVNFSHVDHLTMEGAENTQGLHQFLRCFTDLHRLALRGFRLGNLPEAINQSPQLQELILSDCGITLTPQSLESLSKLTKLTTIDLFRNPLGLTPNVERMPGLNYIDVSETGISELPSGLLSRPKLQTALLNDNQIHALPAALFELPDSTSDGFDLGGNPISVTDRERIKRRFNETRQDFGVLAEPADLQRVQALYTHLDQEQASEFFYLLPGTLAEGRNEIARLENEFSSLSSGLATWVTDLPALHPISGEPFTLEEVLSEHASRHEFKSLLEQSWRRELDEDDFDQDNEPTHDLNLTSTINGELPELDADFSHVSHLYMTSRPGRTSGIERFLQTFPKLKGLTLRQYQLEQIPDAVFRMADLTHLSLSECHITLTPQAVVELAQMHRLEHLDLSDNPLGEAPDVSQMMEMTRLLLDNTGITTLPSGLLQLEQLDLAALNDNAITDVPSDILELPAERGEKINLRNNPFSEASVQRLLAYFRNYRVDFGVEVVINRAELEVSTSEDSEIDE
jgi:Leucine-rich repeat (LRR) protein